MKNYLIFLVTISFCLSCSSPADTGKPNLQIGNYYPDVLHGITFKYDNGQAFLFRIGYLDSADNYIATYNQHLNSVKNGSGQKFGGSAPDYSYNKYGFTTDNNQVVWLEWSLEEQGITVVGKIYSDTSREIILEMLQAWPDFPPVYYKITQNGLAGTLKPSETNPDWFFTILNKKPLANYTSRDNDQALADLISKDKSADLEQEQFFDRAALKYEVSQDEPVYFMAGEVKEQLAPEQIDNRLQARAKAYTDQRFAIHTPFGEIWQAVSNHLNQSRVYGSQSKLSAHVVSRGWCREINQQLYEWDSFFQAMLASIEDPDAGKETVRAILFHQTQEGIVPNVALGNDTTQNSSDRSQPPVGAICVWKMHQYHPDTGFLKEVYPKLLKWHNWWFDIRPGNGLPYRDGNQNGLLEWGTENGTWLQGSKYESGQDNSPMFDDARMNEASRTMELDMAGLSGLWAADALYLSFIAREIGEHEDVEILEQQVENMNQRINDLLWNEAVGMYCNRYWDEFSRKPSVSMFRSISATAIKNNKKTVYKGGKAQKDQNSNDKIGLTDQEVKVLVHNGDSVHWDFMLQPEQSGVYFFYTPEELGVNLTINDQTILDNRKFWITAFISDPIYLNANQQYQIKLAYSGDIPFELLWTTEQKTAGNLFSERLGPTLFYPLIAGAADETKGESIITNLTDTTLFWGEFVLPTIARNDPAFPSQGYWRGRIWPPTNYLAYLGINNYASNEITWQYAVKSARQAQIEWQRRGHLYENYYADGPGAGDPHYCWGGLMQLILLEELAGFETDGQLIANPYSTKEYYISNFPQNQIIN
ncbi:MAG: MGH1-like glycoside hydrolase domain-containing protein [Candidatus Cyclobacteriaceae bacterium M3_2C_046]